MMLIITKIQHYIQMKSNWELEIKPKVMLVYLTLPFSRLEIQV